MKAILEFDLDDEDDRHEYKLANASANLSLAIFSIRSGLREIIKHSNFEGTQFDDSEIPTVEKIQKIILEIIADYHLEDILD